MGVLFLLLSSFEKNRIFKHKKARTYEEIYMQILGLLPPKFHLLVKDLENSDDFLF